MHRCGRAKRGGQPKLETARTHTHTHTHTHTQAHTHTHNTNTNTNTNTNKHTHANNQTVSPARDQLGHGFESGAVCASVRARGERRPAGGRSRAHTHTRARAHTHTPIHKLARTQPGSTHTLTHTNTCTYLNVFLLTDTPSHTHTPTVSPACDQLGHGLEPGAVCASVRARGERGPAGEHVHTLLAKFRCIGRGIGAPVEGSQPGRECG